MRDYLLKRIALTVPIMVGVSLLVAGLIRLVPGDAIMFLVEQAGHVQNLDAARAELGLDRPFVVQYLDWLGGVVRGDFGTSFITSRPVVDGIMRALPVTLELAILSIIVAFMIGIPLGIFSALKQDTWLDYGVRLFGVAGLSMPNFWIATLVLLYFSIWFGWIPPIMYVPFVEDPLRNIQQFVVPALALGTSFSATAMRMTRSALLEVLRQDYIRTATAKGLPRLSVVVRHALKNAMIPVITVLGVQFSNLIGGTVTVEVVFSMPGIGTYTLDAIRQRDYPALQAVVFIVAGMVVLVNLLVDLSYAWLDPRIRYQ